MPNLIRFLNLLTLLFFVCACTNTHNRNTITLDYKDFGPQVIAHELIGNDWWQWEAHGAPDPTIKYDIKVIVYRNVSLAKVKEQFAVNAEQKQDYRYVAYNEAITYLEQHISENFMQGMTKRLADTKAHINQKLSL